MARPEVSSGPGSGRDCRPAAPQELGLLLPVSRLNNEPQTAAGHFRQPRPLPRKHSRREGLSDGRFSLWLRRLLDCRTPASRFSLAGQILGGSADFESDPHWRSLNKNAEGVADLPAVGGATNEARVRGLATD